MILNPAYIAGVIDSDGSITITKAHRGNGKYSYYLSIQITWSMTKYTKLVFETLKSKYGGSISEINNRNGYTKNKMYYKYMVVSRQAELFLKDIAPFLILKRNQARLGSLLCKTTVARGSTGAGRTKPKKLIQFHEGLYQKNKELNTKNGKEGINVAS